MIIKIGLTIIIVFAVIVGIIVWVQGRIQEDNSKSFSIKQNQEELGAEIVGENNSISVDTWKQYINKDDKYSLKYPSDWDYSSYDGVSFFVKGFSNKLDFSKVLSSSLKNISGDYFINISIYKRIGEYKNLNEWRKNDGNDYQRVLINGYPALKFEESSYKSYDNKNGNMTGVLRYYFIDKNNTGYEITVLYKDNSNGIGDKIIYTFNSL